MTSIYFYYWVKGTSSSISWYQVSGNSLVQKLILNFAKRKVWLKITKPTHFWEQFDEDWKIRINDV